MEDEFDCKVVRKLHSVASIIVMYQNHNRKSVLRSQSLENINIIDDG